MALRREYEALNSASPRASVTSTLAAVANAQYSRDDRRFLAQLLLADIDTSGPGSRLSEGEIPPALVAVKTLCRHPDASSVVVSDSNLRILHQCSRMGPPADIEALRCVANGLLTQMTGVDLWVEMGGGDDCLEWLQRDDSTAERTFVAARVLFLVTIKPSEFMMRAVRESQLVNIVASGLDRAFAQLQGKQPFAKEAVIDLLKVSFNVMVHFTRTDSESPESLTPRSDAALLGDLWDAHYESLVDPLFRLLQTLPSTSPSPLQPPMTYVLHNLINVPTQGNNASKWITPISGSESSLDPLNTLWNLLDAVLAYYISYDPDDADVRAKCRAEGIVLDELVVPLPIILGRLAHSIQIARERMRALVLPSDLDRTRPLEGRRDLLGRCIRLMVSVHHPHLKVAIGEMLFEICDGDATRLASQIGYGNAAGFLFSKGISAAPSQGFSADGSPLNPITGTNVLPPPTVDMTDEEKEAEAERLFVLFDRLERTGMGVNPIRQAQQEGRLQ